MTGATVSFKTVIVTVFTVSLPLASETVTVTSYVPAFVKSTSASSMTILAVTSPSVSSLAVYKASKSGTSLPIVYVMASFPVIVGASESPHAAKTNNATRITKTVNNFLIYNFICTPSIKLSYYFILFYEKIKPYIKMTLNGVILWFYTSSKL
jgi:hypothetical protein